MTYKAETKDTETIAKMEFTKKSTVVNFYDKVADELLKFAVIITVHDGKYVFCKC